ncbi:hypothetical protein [Noviherbaspirillum saxi]|uniref:Uncharacterized protein n=1 Tax=Noviherbaspirillum saxi TaxID=2320863 RepID=A0A3A3FUE2_9BURK|nr:hypothetical protein [Noviherbaspirillum saxi]RJF99150.1 hypothetical protein D3871_11970 [Noviherbaspirillum saxi]
MANLTFYFSKPSDLLEKLRRDCARLCSAVSVNDQEKIADCLFDFASTSYSLKDWMIKFVKVASPKEYVEKYVKNNAALDACRDICNANKHYVITNYTPITDTVYASTTSATSLSITVPGSGVPLELDPNLPIRIKVVLTDGTRYEVCDLCQQAIDAWATFISTNSVP